MRKRHTFRRKSVRRKPTRSVSVSRRELRPKYQPNTVYRFSSSKKALESMSNDARCVLFLGGHIVNELTTLHRLLLFTRAQGDEIENNYTGVQYVAIVRLLIGKVAEGLDVVQRRIFGKPFGQRYLPLIEKRPDGKLVVARLKKMVGGSGLLRRLRNEHAFHNPTDDVLTTAFNKLGDTENWSMLAAGSRHTVLLPMSHLVTLQALIDATGKADAKEAIELIRDETLGAADALISLFEILVIAMSEANDVFNGNPVPVKDTSSLPDALGVSIPPLCRET